MMKQIVLLSVLLLSTAPAYKGQSGEIEVSRDSLSLSKSVLLSQLQALEIEAAKLDRPVARALAKTEIADAVWTLDKTWAEKLLREAYKLTLPDEEDQIIVHDRPMGAPPVPPTSDMRARESVRNRVLAIARRDKELVAELTKIGEQQLGIYEAHSKYASLASEAIESGDKEAANKYISQSIEADPTQIGAGLSILELAAKDRAAADQATLQYLDRLRAYPLSISNQSAIRVYVILRQMLFPGANANPKGTPVSSAGATVIKSYMRISS